MKEKTKAVEVLCSGRLVIIKPCHIDYKREITNSNIYEKADVILQDMSDETYLVTKNVPESEVGNIIQKKEITKFLLRVGE